MIRRLWDVTLPVSDLKESARFYGEVLGRQKKYEFRDYAGFDCGGVEIGLKTWGEREEPRQGEPVVNFLVDDIDKTYQELRKHGVQFVGGPKDTQWGARIALFLDPDGHTLQLTQVDWGKYFAACAPR
jgi:catechol 2,3-dioxygenase-like lactoylglutathione lyase family enzyme